MKEVSEPVKHKLPLLLDASSSPIHAGIPSEEGWIHLEALDLQALEGLFEATTLVMEKAGRSLREVDAVFFCEGPGSTLGLRLAAALVKTLLWESRGKLSIYAYNALDLAARIPESLRSTSRRPSAKAGDSYAPRRETSRLEQSKSFRARKPYPSFPTAFTCQTPGTRTTRPPPPAPYPMISRAPEV